MNSYDGNGFRTSKTIDGVTNRFINDRGSVAGEVVGEYYDVADGKTGGFMEKYDETNNIKYFEYLGQLLEMGLHI